MRITTTERSAENMAFVRRLLKLKQPEFSAALEMAADAVRRELRVSSAPAGLVRDRLSAFSGR